MLTSHTSSEEENIPHLRKFLQNIRNNNEGPQLHKCCENIVPRFQTWSILPPSQPPDWSLNYFEENFLQPVLKSFFIVFIQCNEGLENKPTRTLLLGLAKSMYW